MTFLEIVPALFAAVTVMLVALTRLEQNLGRDPAPARAPAPTRAAVAMAASRTRVRAALPSAPPRARPAATAQQAIGGSGR